MTVCVVPALAGDYSSNFPGFVYPQANAEILYTSGGTSLNVLNGYFPASFGVFGDGSQPGTLISGSVLPWQSNPSTLTLPSDLYIEVLFPVEMHSTVTVEPFSNTAYSVGDAQLGLGLGSGFGVSSISFTSYDVQFNLDGKYTALTKTGNYWFGVPDSFEVDRYWGFRYFFKSGTKSGNTGNNWNCRMKMPDYNKYSIVGDIQYAIYDEVVVNTGLLQEINGKLTEIQTSTTQIKNDVSEIKGGLQDSNSSIWGAFKDSVSGLFVPSSSDLESVKSGFDQLAQEKLGGAYQTVELVDNGVQSVVNKFKNPGSNPGVEFPGISVPLGGDVGTVTLAASQTVTIPEQITDVLYPVSGVIIPIVCAIWTIRQCTDMVECFMSGMSYAEFLHRNSDKEDDEV